MLLSRQRLHSRLQSKHWDKPDYFRAASEPLYQGLRNVFHYLERRRPRSSITEINLSQKMDELCDAYQRVNDHDKNTESELECLKDVVRLSHDLCTSSGRRTIEETLSAYGFERKVACDNKYIRQANKIGRYWGLCEFMAQVSRKFGDLFENIYLQTLPSYMEVKSPISFKGGPGSCHVHAEIQLLIFYGKDLSLAASTPHVLGVSKAACYLCDLFIHKHGQFFITKTHGRLHDQWTVPDLAEFSQRERDNYRRILIAVNKEIENAIVNMKTNCPNRNYPLGSWLSLPTAFLMSPAMSNTGTVVSENSQHTSVTPRIPSRASTPRPIPRPVADQTTEVYVIPEIAVYSSSNSSPSPSPQSLSQPEFPIRKIITTSSPFHITAGNLSLGFELEGPGQHEVTIRYASGDAARGQSIDVGKMLPGDPLHIERNKDEYQLVFSLCSGSDTSLQIVLCSRIQGHVSG